jgi:succinate-acetate transporter protein
MCSNRALKPSTAASPTSLATHRAHEFYLLSRAIVTGILTLGALRLTGPLSNVSALSFLPFILLALGEFTTTAGGVNPDGRTKRRGWVGILTAMAAWYTAVAGVLQSVSGGAVMLPTFRPVLRAPERVIATRQARGPHPPAPSPTRSE